MKASPEIPDRAAGVLIGTAVGDALGAGYEFALPTRPDDITMRPGRLTGRPAGQWTDDTDMCLAIALAAREHGTLSSTAAIETVGENFLSWFASNPPDIGMQTRAVLSQCRSSSELAATASEFQRTRPDAAGNGSLMRTAAVALADHHQFDDIARAAATISALTHPHRDAQSACVIWSVAIGAGLRGSTSLHNSLEVAMDYLDATDRALWSQRLREAEDCDRAELSPNGWVVTALRAAWRACHEASSSPINSAYSYGVRFAISLGADTDTVAAIAGGLLGAHVGASNIPADWRSKLGGWPVGLGDSDLVALATELVTAST